MVLKLQQQLAQGDAGVVGVAEECVFDDHRRTAPGSQAFDEVLHILHDVLVAHKMEEADIKAVADLVLSHKNDIVEIENTVRVHKT